MNIKPFFSLIFFTVMSFSMHAVDDISKKPSLEEYVANTELLSNLGKKITEQEELLAMIEKKIADLIEKCTEEQKNILIKENKNRQISEQEIEAIKSSIHNELESFQDNFFELAKKNEKPGGALLEEYANNVQQTKSNCRGLLTFYSIRQMYEYIILWTLIAQWEHRSNEFNKIYFKNDKTVLVSK